MRFRSRSRFRLATLIAAAGLVPLGLGGAAAARSPAHEIKERPALTAAQVLRLAAHATDRSIIIFKHQLSNLPARGATTRLRINAASASQAPVLAELAQLHATQVRSFHIINAIAATISSAEVKRLRANPAVRAVVPDAMRKLTPLASKPGPVFPARARPAQRRPTRGRGLERPAGDPAQQVCPSNPAQPLIEPEARTLLNVDAANQLADGSGIKVGIIADGIDPSNPDLIRPGGQHVITDYRDFSGQGPRRPPTAGWRSSPLASSPRRAIRSTTCRSSSTRRTRCRLAATSRSRASPPARAWR